MSVVKAVSSWIWISACHVAAALGPWTWRRNAIKLDKMLLKHGIFHWRLHEFTKSRHCNASNLFLSLLLQHRTRWFPPFVPDSLCERHTHHWSTVTHSLFHFYTSWWSAIVGALEWSGNVGGWATQRPNLWMAWTNGQDLLVFDGGRCFLDKIPYNVNHISGMTRPIGDVTF